MQRETTDRKKKKLHDVKKNNQNQCIQEINYPAVVAVPKSRGSRAIYRFNRYTTHNNIGDVQNIGFTPYVFVQCLRNTTGIANRRRRKHSSRCLEWKTNGHDFQIQWRDRAQVMEIPLWIFSAKRKHESAKHERFLQTWKYSSGADHKYR